MHKILIIQTKDFGDAIITTHFVKLINLIECELHILTKPIFKNIFREYSENLKGHYSQFPIGKTRSFKILGLLKLLIEIIKLRREKFNIIVSYYGDIRDHILARLIKSEIILGVYWGKNHPYQNKKWNAHRKFLDEVICIDSRENIYVLINNVVKRIYKILGKFPNERISGKNIIISPQNPFFSLGIHPFAGKSCSEWSFENWNKLIALLMQEESIKITIFSSPQEEELLNLYFTDLKKNDSISFFSKNVKEFLIKLSTMNLFIGLDSFSIHAAYLKGVPRILLNGPNDPLMWAPSETYILGNGSNCKYYPCYNQPKCINTDFEFICINGISPEAVFKQVQKLLIKDR